MSKIIKINGKEFQIQTIERPTEHEKFVEVRPQVYEFIDATNVIRIKMNVYSEDNIGFLTSLKSRKVEIEEDGDAFSNLDLLGMIWNKNNDFYETNLIFGVIKK